MLIMNKMRPLHKAQIAILETLRHRESARYSDMRKRAGLDSDVFKFHIRAMVQTNTIKKRADGTYELTQQGKEFANFVDEDARTVLKQPKMSLLLVVNSHDGRWLLHTRKRNPFFGFTGFLSGPAQWDEAFELTAQKEFYKQTGIQASFHPMGVRRQRDIDNTTGVILEDKLFIVMRATTDELGSRSWYAGTSKWYSETDFATVAKLFASTQPVIDQITNNVSYVAAVTAYAGDVY